MTIPAIDIGSARVYLAVDLGGGSGRVMAGRWDGSRLALDEVHRFEVPTVAEGTGLFWDLPAIWASVLDGLRAAAQLYPTGSVRSIGVDSWGVDYGYIDRSGQLLRLPHHYRDPRTHGLVEAVTRQVPASRIFDATGIQFMPINTLYQLYADRQEPGGPQRRASRFLLVPDILNFWMTGEPVCERSNASTTQIYGARSRDWCRWLAEALDIPSSLFPPLVDAGTVLGPLRADVADGVGLPRVPVVAVGSHDTASAVAAVPATTARPAYLSSGTWSLLGAEVSSPVLTPDALRFNFTNEAGVAGNIRLLKNINGLWILEECRRTWRAPDGTLPRFAELIDAASGAPPLRSLIDPDAPRFTAGGDLPEAIRDFCRRSGQPIPESHGEVVRAVTDSLALKYALVLGDLERLLGHETDVLHVVGGGSRDPRLNQATSDAAGRPVEAGPVEATAAGNVLVQMLADGAIRDLAEGRAAIRNSFPVTRFEPAGDPEAWSEARGRLRDVTHHHPGAGSPAGGPG